MSNNQRPPLSIPGGGAHGTPPSFLLLGENAASLPDSPATDPCVLVIFGATGDLTLRKLMKALCHLDKKDLLPELITIIGVDRNPMSNHDFRLLIGTTAQVEKSKNPISDDRLADEILEDERWVKFLHKLSYLACNLKETKDYIDLANTIRRLNYGVLGNRLFYCATPPTLVNSIIEGLDYAGLANELEGWSRIIIEKPFGRDLSSAQRINETVLSVFQEHQVYRIDHYLGKETVQNILVFRFGNALFEPVWNRDHIDYIEITAAETLGVGRRGGYYEETGALRDMVTNHLLQLLALVAMEPPITFDPDAVRDKRTQVWRTMKPMTLDEVAQKTVRGQYNHGQINDDLVPGYRDESGVSIKSETETYVAAEFRIENWRWAGVPFYLRTGKRLAKGVTEITVHFKRPPQPMFADRQDIEPNVIAFHIYPDEGIDISFDAKRPGSDMKTANVLMDFRYQDAFDERIPEAYEALLLDALNGDATLFTRKDGVEAQWRIIDPILDAWRKTPGSISSYAAGSEGPSEADALLARNGHAWRVLGDKK